VAQGVGPEFIQTPVRQKKKKKEKERKKKTKGVVMLSQTKFH
jgi:hypothetical protein